MDKKLTGAFVIKFKTEDGKKDIFQKYNLSNYYPFNLKFGEDLLFLIKPSEESLLLLTSQLKDESEVEWVELEILENIGPRS